MRAFIQPVILPTSLQLSHHYKLNSFPQTIRTHLPFAVSILMDRKLQKKSHIFSLSISLTHNPAFSPLFCFRERKDFPVWLQISLSCLCPIFSSFFLLDIPTFYLSPLPASLLFTFPNSSEYPRQDT